MFRWDLGCKLGCQKDAIDCQSQTLSCQKVLEKLTPDELKNIKAVKYSDIIGSLEEQRKVAWILILVMEIRNEILENSRLPVGHSLDLSLQLQACSNGLGDKKGDRSLTRDLQSTPFQNPGGVAQA